MSSTETVPADKPARLTSLDAYRGFVMLAMASAGLALHKAAQQPEVLSRFDGTPYSAAWKSLCGVVAYQLEHVPWTGCGFWDLIQPSFMFMVGVAMPYSYARRQSLGASPLSTAGHVVLRSLILVFLGIFLSSNWSKQTNFTFVNVLTQIGLGYSFVYLLLGRGPRVQLAAIAAILVGYWYLFFQHPLPPADFDYASMNVPADWQYLTGMAAHWNKHTNFAAWFDAQWLGRGFMNLFPREKEFRFNEGGLSDPQFRPVDGDDDPRADGGRAAPRPVIADRESEAARVVGRALPGARHGGRRHDLAVLSLPMVAVPDRQTNLDPELGGLFERLDVLDARRILLGHRHQEMEGLGLPAGRRRDEFDRHVLHGAIAETMDQLDLEDPLRPAHFRRPRRPHRAGRRTTVCDVADLPVDVPAEDLRAHLIAVLREANSSMD
jgi:hypothetical protein